MHSDENLVKTFYTKTLKIMYNSNKIVCHEPIINYNSIPTALELDAELSIIPEKNESKILDLISRFSENDCEAVETDVNSFLAKMFDCELSFFVFKDIKKYNFFMMSVGGKRFFEKEEFLSANLQIANKNQPLKKEVFEEKEIRKVITKLYKKQVMSSTSIYTNYKFNGNRIPFFIVLFNKLISLPERKLSTKYNMENQRCIRMYSEFTSEETDLLRNISKLVIPIVIPSILDGSFSKRMSFLSEMSRLICNPSNTVWLEIVVKMSLQQLDVEIIGIYIISEDQKYFNGVLVSRENVDIFQVVEIPVTYGLIGKVYVKKESILLNDPSDSKFSSKLVANIFKICIRNAYCTPIKIGDAVGGVFEITNKKGNITMADIENAQTIANMCVLALVV